MQQHFNKLSNTLALAFVFTNFSKHWEDYEKMELNEMELLDLTQSISQILNLPNQNSSVLLNLKKSIDIFKTDWSIGINLMINKVSTLELSERLFVKELMINRLNEFDSSLPGISKARSIVEIM